MIVLCSKDNDGVRAVNMIILMTVLAIKVHVKVTYSLFNINNWGVRFDNQTLCIFRNGRIDCKDAFYAVLCLQRCVMG